MAEDRTPRTVSTLKWALVEEFIDRQLVGDRVMTIKRLEKWYPDHEYSNAIQALMELANDSDVIESAGDGGYYLVSIERGREYVEEEKPDYPPPFR